MAETDKKLQDAAAAAQLGENQSSSCSFHLGLSETCENAIKHQKKKIKKRNEEDGFAWKGRNIQQLAAFWKSPSGDGGSTQWHTGCLGTWLSGLKCVLQHAGNAGAVLGQITLLMDDKRDFL